MKNEKLLFEIPIYALSKSNFERKWEKRKKSEVDSYIKVGNSKERAFELFEKYNYPKNVWKYNQVIGFINIFVIGDDIELKLFCSREKNVRVTFQKKYFITDCMINGTHFYVEDKDNDFIKNEIGEFLEMIKEEILPKKYYVDDSAYKNVIEYIDLKGIISDYNYE